MVDALCTLSPVLLVDGCVWWMLLTHFPGFLVDGYMWWVYVGCWWVGSSHLGDSYCGVVRMVVMVVVVVIVECDGKGLLFVA
jgi:hypothetical protein